MNTVNTSPHFESGYSATSVEKMILGETQYLYHLMFGIAGLIRLPLKVISDRLLRPQSLTTHGDRGIRRRVSLEYLGYLRCTSNTPPHLTGS
jgi:hypothetical protein